ncbi:hypothetical protein OsJ_26869 [Oryza sativa Japonica Group]|uniref:Uncharacterized protein n=1 Tax=Oryza sativa subsp. japonica TaxID=39947 RepID=A3BRV7_ORYSJ|nr:hypothetical protein OsJ_26869 [Oryza sativa Japonica Group]BAD01729.1 hypothetical protein [Oryza sativa Japonica Group]BAD03338.1 hypothetical protein [Oryza sativa Japonica Group]
MAGIDEAAAGLDAAMAGTDAQSRFFSPTDWPRARRIRTAAMTSTLTVMAMARELELMAS